MKLVGRIGLILALLFAYVPVQASDAAEDEGPPSVYGSNLINNGKFDSGFDWWGIYPATLGELSSYIHEFSIAASPFQSENSALKIHTAGIPEAYGVTEAHQWVEVQPHQLFTLSSEIFFESSVDSMITMRIDFYDENVDYNSPSSSFISYEYKDIYHQNNAFEPLTLSGVVPDRAKKAKIEFDIKAFEAGAGGTVYIDDVQLYYQWAPTQLRATNQTDTSITLEWDKPSDGGAYNYEIYESFAERFGEEKKPDLLIGEVDNTEAAESTTFTWSNLASASSANRITAHWLYVVAKPISDPTISSQPSNILRIARSNPSNTFTILPLGDSMTVGIYGNGVVPGGYRGYLWELMQDKYSNMFYVGSENYNPLADPNFNPDHEGHSGYLVSRMNEELVESRIAVYAPDYVIVHAGTNNMWEIRNMDETYMKRELLSHMSVLLSNIREALPDTYVIVASSVGKSS